MAIKMTDLMKRLISDALADGVPCLVGTATREGRPQISPKGSLAVLDDETLCYWERSFRSSENRLRENPNIVVYYRNPARAGDMPYRGAALRFHGTARIVEEGVERDQVWKLTPALERERDPQRKGHAVLIQVDLIEELSGAVVMARD